MNIRHLQLPFALALALGASSAHALGLGQIEVKSGLNQPLVAEIPILSAGPGELDELEVRLASPEAFARVGLERPVGLTANLQISVGRNAAGQPVIRVTTPDRFSEPFLTFLLEANWGRGSVVREYSALVDPPYIAPAVIRPLETPSVAATPAPVFVPPVARPEPEAETAALPDPEPTLVVTEIAPEPVAAPEPEPVAATPPPAPEARPLPAPLPASPDSLGPVSEGQTLWSIASAVRPDSEVTVNQMMLALQRANPEAFIADNINQLKRGAVLRIPAREEVASLGAAEAAALVREQASAWQSRRQPVPQPAEAMASAPAPAPTRPTVARPAARPVEGRLEIVPPSGDELAARGVQSGASGAGGGSELRAELTQAREDLAAREAEVAELRSQMAELEQQQADSQRLIQMQDSQMKALQDRLGQADAAPASPAATPATTASEPAVAEPWYLNPFLLGGGGLVLLGGLVLTLRGRRSASPVPLPGRRISDDAALKASLAGARMAEPAPPQADLDETPEPDPKDAARMNLQQAVRSRPDDLEAHIALLRHHYAHGDKAGYDAAAQAMRAKIRSTLDPRWREAVVMGVALSPGNPLFSQAGWNSPRLGDTGVMSASPASTPAPTPAPASPPAPAIVPELDDLSALDVTPKSPVEDPAEDWESLGSIAVGEPAADLDEAVSLDPVVAEAEEDGSDTKIELAKAYLDIGDIDGARDMLEEVLAEAGPAGRAEAARLLKEIG